MTPLAIELKILRIRREVTQGALANMLGCRQAYLSKYENGCTVRPRPDFLQKIVDRLILSADEEARLRHAAAISRIHCMPPPGVHADAYRFAAQLAEIAPSLTTVDYSVLERQLQDVLRRRMTGAD